jgi:ribose 5-phosphate isomerase RpiB
LRIGDRVVTLAVLQGRLEGIRRVHVPSHALVTPAVGDDLRKRGIALVRGETMRGAEINTTTSADQGLLVGAAGTAQDLDALVKVACAELPGVTCVSGGGLADVLQRLTQAIVEQRRHGVLFTQQPAAAVCVANRRRGVRAAHGWGVAAMADATRSIGANLLVVNPAAHSVFQLRRMIREFAAAGVRECPAEWQAALEG